MRLLPFLALLVLTAALPLGSEAAACTFTATEEIVGEEGMSAAEREQARLARERERAEAERARERERRNLRRAAAEQAAAGPDRGSAALAEMLVPNVRPIQMWIGLPVTAIAASFIASEWVGWAWQV
jgi:hypothetical protein